MSLKIAMTKSMLLIVGILFQLPVFAQVTVQVITKKIEKTYNYQDGYELNIEGEKAQVSIESWDQDKISITLEITAKHPDKAIAERDLEAMQYLTQKVKNKIYLRNYLSPKEGAPAPEASFEAVYYVRVPPACPVYLKNYFGVANISNLNNRFRFNGEFSKIDLENISGSIDLRSRFGDIFGNHLDGIVNIWSRRSNVTLNDIRGSFDITAQYGTLRIFAEDRLLKLNIDAEKSDVYFFNPNPEFYGYTLTANNGNVVFPGELSYEEEDNKADQRKIKFKPPREYFANITITVTIGDIHVEKATQPKM
ncbi:hypothetical protein [Flavilitoribacter nigricans]|nr:hypothetical protein [Flavilitoribacter nigricans]